MDDSAALSEIAPVEMVTVKTTGPIIPPLETRPEIKTQRLILRGTTESDLQGWHILRSAPEVMRWSAQGGPDPNLAHSKTKLEARLPPAGDAKFEYVVCIAETGQMIGTAGCHLPVGELGWPELGYMLLPEAWGKGYATEMMQAFLQAWWALPRKEIELSVDKGTVSMGADGKATETIIAMTHLDNVASQRVLTKVKMPLIKMFEEKSTIEPSTSEVVKAYVSRRRVQQLN